jgi:hypothetical protein
VCPLTCARTFSGHRRGWCCDFKLSRQCKLVFVVDVARPGSDFANRRRARADFDGQPVTSYITALFLSLFLARSSFYCALSRCTTLFLVQTYFPRWHKQRCVLVCARCDGVYRSLCRQISMHADVCITQSDIVQNSIVQIDNARIGTAESRSLSPRACSTSSA